MIGPSTDDTDLDPILGLPLLVGRVGILLMSKREKETYPSKTVEDVNVFPGVQVIDGALAVDLKSVCRKRLMLFRHSLVRAKEKMTYARPF